MEDNGSSSYAALANSELGGEQGEEAAIAETQRIDLLPEACKALLIVKQPAPGLKVSIRFALSCFACMNEG